MPTATKASPKEREFLNRLASKGRGQDSIIAHINPKEAAMLRRMGGKGTPNPKTGLLEFDGGGDYSGSYAAETGTQDQNNPYSAPPPAPPGANEQAFLDKLLSDVGGDKAMYNQAVGKLYAGGGGSTYTGGESGIPTDQQIGNVIGYDKAHYKPGFASGPLAGIGNFATSSPLGGIISAIGFPLVGAGAAEGIGALAGVGGLAGAGGGAGAAGLAADAGEAGALGASGSIGAANAAFDASSSLLGGADIASLGGGASLADLTSQIGDTSNIFATTASDATAADVAPVATQGLGGSLTSDSIAALGGPPTDVVGSATGGQAGDSGLFGGLFGHIGDYLTGGAGAGGLGSSFLQDAGTVAKIVAPIVSGASLASSLAGQKSGVQSLPQGPQVQAQGQKLQDIGNKLTAPLVDGAPLPAGAQAQVDQSKQAQKAHLRSTFASLGMTGSTEETTALNQIDSQSASQSFDIASKLATQGISAIGGSNLIYTQLMNAQLAQDSALQKAIANFSSALGGGTRVQIGGGNGF